MPSDVTGVTWVLCTFARPIGVYAIARVARVSARTRSGSMTGNGFAVASWGSRVSGAGPSLASSGGYGSAPGVKE